MASISQNQYDYLNNLVSAGGGNGEWAKSQLNGANVYAPPPASSSPKPTTTTPTPYSQGNNYGTNYSPNVPAPAAVYAPAPTYQSSAPSYSAPSYNTPAPAASSYTGASSVIGNVSGSSDLGKSYQSIYDSTRTPSTANSQLNTWADNKGNVYDTTKMTPQQIYALSLFKDGNQNASAILKGMGLDMNGNPTSPSGGYTNIPPTPAETRGASGGGLNASTTYYPGMNATSNSSPQYNQGNSPQLTGTQQSAADWINSSGSGQGGIANYVKGQQAKYDAALASGDRDMINRLNADMQRVWYTLNTGNQMTAQSGQPAATASNNPYGLSSEQYNALISQADAQLGQQRSSLAQSVNSAIAGLRNNNDYTSQLTKDNRAIEDSQFKETNNPFNGMTSYRTAMNDRSRSIQDTAVNKDYNTQVAALQQKLADFEAGSAAQKQSIVNQLAQQLLQTNLQTGQLTGTFNGQRTLAGQNQDFNQQQDVKKQHIDLANFLTQQYGVTVHPTDDPLLSYAQVAGVPTVAAKKIAMDAQNMNFDNAVKKALAENTINKTQADIMQQAQHISISQQNANTSAASAAASAGNAANRLAWDKDPSNPDNLYKQSEIAKNKSAIDANANKYDPSYLKAIEMAQKEPLYGTMSQEQQAAAIDKYYKIIKPKEQSSGGSGLSDEELMKQLSQYTK